jgi:nucleoside-diphosphate-sugar epimerase
VEKITSPRLLVIGGSGFIGRHVVQRAVCQGWDVTSVGLNCPEHYRRVSGARYMGVDLTRADLLTGIGDNRFDYVVNLGGYIDHSLFRNGGRKLIRSHFDGLLNLLEFLDISCIRRFVQIGSSDEYGAAQSPQREDMRERPISPYALAKVAATHFLQMMYRTEGFPAVTLRLFLTYGPGQDDKRFLPKIIKGCLYGLEFPASRGEQLRDFCYVEDVVRAIFLALESNVANGEIFNVGSGEPVRIRTLVEKVCSIVGSGRPNFGLIPYRPDENMVLVADTRKIRDSLGWAPEVGMDDGLQLTIESIKDEYA